MKFCWPHNCLEVDMVYLRCLSHSGHSLRGGLVPCDHAEKNCMTNLIKRLSWSQHGKKKLSVIWHMSKPFVLLAALVHFIHGHYWNQIALRSIIMEQKSLDTNNLSCPNNDGNLAAVLFQPGGQKLVPTLKRRTRWNRYLCQGPNQWVKRAARSNNNSLFCLALENPTHQTKKKSWKWQGIL